MGRSFESVRMGVRDISMRWDKAGRAMKKEDQCYAREISLMAKKHTSEAFYAMDDPLEAAVFSVLIEILKARAHEADGVQRNGSGEGEEEGSGFQEK